MTVNCYNEKKINEELPWWKNATVQNVMKIYTRGPLHHTLLRRNRLCATIVNAGYTVRASRRIGEFYACLWALLVVNCYAVK